MIFIKIWNRIVPPHTIAYSAFSIFCRIKMLRHVHFSLKSKVGKSIY